jgi:hypothetical protein
MSDDVTALLIALARENAELREQLAAAHYMLVETAIDAGNLHARIEAVQIECDAWRAEAERLRGAVTRVA